MKLPLVFAFFHIAEQQTGFLQSLVVYSREIPEAPKLNQSEISQSSLQEGQLYPIEKLLHDMIVYSDNGAYFSLVAYANQMLDGPEQVLTTFQELGIVDPRTPDEEVVSVRGHASLYRQLYNASYLSVKNSEKVLSWLAESEFDKGIAAGVPVGVPVGNKFGERELPGGQKQLHDCGIVFFPGNPYTLCVMTKGGDYEKLVEVIREISRMVYVEVGSRRL